MMNNGLLCAFGSDKDPKALLVKTSFLHSTSLDCASVPNQVAVLESLDPLSCFFQNYSCVMLLRYAHQSRQRAFIGKHFSSRSNTIERPFSSKYMTSYE